MTGYEVTWPSPMGGPARTSYYCESCSIPTGPSSHVRGPITLPADAVCAACGKVAESDAQRFRDLTKLPGYSTGYEAGYGEAQKADPLPGSYLRILQQILDRVLTGEPAAQVVADFPDEYGYTIEGLERVERLVSALRKLVGWGWGADAPAECHRDHLDARALLKEIAKDA